MNIEQDGSLSFGVIDLCKEFRDDVPDQAQFQHFGVEANIAAAYALAMKRPVRFITPGKLQDVEGLPHPCLACTENIVIEKQGACLSEKEEADLVLQHMGWASAWAHVVMCAEILFDTKDVDYDLSVDPECGHSVRSSLVIRPHIKPDDWPFEKIRERTNMLHKFIELANKEIYMMCCVNVFYEANPEPADNPSDVDSEKEE